MAKEKTTLRFWLRSDKPNKDGSAPVHLIYQVQGQRKYYAIPDVKLFPVNWDAVNQQAVYKDRKAAKAIKPDIDFKTLITASEVNDINGKLQDVCNNVSDIETRYKLDETTFSAKMVTDALKVFRKPVTKKEEPGVNVVDFIKRFVKDSTGTHTLGTLKVYTGLAAHLTDFEKARKFKFTFDTTDVATFRAFHSFLTDKKMMNNITAAKQMSTLKTLLNYARVTYKYKVNIDYRDYTVSRKDSEFEVITLTQDEFDAICNLDLSQHKRLDAVKDIFCFSCATGLRYSDLQQLQRVHIRKDNTIRMTASKTGQKLVIPLTPISHSILQKYAERLKPLPVISNQKTNDYLKEIGELAGIDTPVEKVRKYGIETVSKEFKKYELLSIHVGRKTFISLSLEKGMAIQEVMKISGHRTHKAFRRYVNVEVNTLIKTMGNAWGSVNPLKAVNGYDTVTIDFEKT